MVEDIVAELFERRKSLDSGSRVLRSSWRDSAVELDGGGVGVAALESEAVEGPVAAAFPVATDSLVREPIWVAAAASFVGGTSAVLLSGADGSLVETVVVLEVGVDGVATDKGVQEVGHESALHGAGPGSAVAVGVVLGALAGDADVGAADGRGVLDLPRDAGGAFVFSVPHGALVAVMKDLAHLINSILGLALASAVVVAKVAPAAVLVDLLDGLGDGAGECLFNDNTIHLHGVIIFKEYSSKGSGGQEGEFHQHGGVVFEVRLKASNRVFKSF